MRDCFDRRSSTRRCARLGRAAVVAVGVVAALLALLVTTAGASAATLTVTTESDEGGAVQNTVACSLREAILVTNGSGAGAGTNVGAGQTGCVNGSANGFGADDRIEFAIPAGTMQNAPVARIRPNPRLPIITTPVTIDGYTQAGASPNTNAANAANPSGRGLNTVIRVEIDGGSAQGSGPILRLQADGSTITGLAIFNSPVDGIRIIGGGNRIVGNFIGTNAAGGGSGNASDGVSINGPGDENVIGATTPASRNLISHNGQQGVRIASDANRVQGNLIGTKPNGRDAFGNQRQGVLVSVGFENVVGGSESARNVIAGNRLDGILVKDCACATGDTEISWNFIGVDATGNTALPNGQSGIQVRFEPENTLITQNVISGNTVDGIKLDAPGLVTTVTANLIGVGADRLTAVGNGRHGIFLNGTFAVLIGGQQPADGNVIARNGADGIAACACSESNLLLSNSIHSNGGLAVDLDDDGVTPNDDGNDDADTGANGLQNFPVLTEAVAVDGRIRVSGTLDSAPNEQYLIQLFANPSCDASGFGEARTFIGSFEVSTGGNGLAQFTSPSFTFAAPGNQLTATASDTAGNTSELSQCLTAVSRDAGPLNTSDGDDPPAKPSREVKPVKETDEQRQQRERTNASNLDEYRTEGNVVGLCAADAAPACVYVANRDGVVLVILLDEAAKAFGDIRIGDYLEADGEKIDEQRFEATSVSVRRGRR